MIQFLRSFRLTYMLYNFFHRKLLIHNVLAYKKLGLNKRYFSSISSEDFKKCDATPQEFCSPEALEKTEIYCESDADQKENLRNYISKGYVVLPQFFDSRIIDSINLEVDTLVKSKRIKAQYTNRIMFAFRQSNTLRTAATDSKLKELLDVLIGGEAVLFQSINFEFGTEQRTHSDMIHMSTYPLGGLIGVWVALEDITYENGPLHYYPESHLLPYYLNESYNNKGTKFRIGNQPYSAYESMIEGKLKESNLSKEIFLAKKGDVLLWHANLLHGAEKQLDKTKTRKSVVFHYFKKGVVCYHEITQRPALIQEN